MAGWTGTPFQISGNGSATKEGMFDTRYSITGVWACFMGPGPQTGVLRILIGDTPVWEATVSGAFMFRWAFREFTTEPGDSVTVELPGAQVRLDCMR